MGCFGGGELVRATLAGGRYDGRDESGEASATAGLAGTFAEVLDDGAPPIAPDAGTAGVVQLNRLDDDGDDCCDDDGDDEDVSRRVVAALGGALGTA